MRIVLPQSQQRFRLLLSSEDDASSAANSDASLGNMVADYVEVGPDVDGDGTPNACDTDDDGDGVLDVDDSDPVDPRQLFFTEACFLQVVQDPEAPPHPPAQCVHVCVCLLYTSPSPRD